MLILLTFDFSGENEANKYSKKKYDLAKALQFHFLTFGIFYKRDHIELSLLLKTLSSHLVSILKLIP